MIESFCLICARRYSRLLISGEKSEDGAGDGQREGEGETESVEVKDGEDGISDILQSFKAEREKLKRRERRMGFYKLTAQMAGL